MKTARMLMSVSLAGLALFSAYSALIWHRPALLGIGIVVASVANIVQLERRTASLANLHGRPVHRPDAFR
jgi:hypothetical protein